MNKIHGELIKPRKWFDLKETEKETEIYIYDVIGPDFWGDGLRAIDLVRQINDVKGEQITLHINSPGGDVFDGMAIRHALDQSGKKIRTVVDGIAASIASVIFAAGTERVMPVGSMVMIHKAWTYAVGNDTAMEKAAERLKKVDDQIVNSYKSILGMKEDEIRKAMDEETYYTSDEAMKNGFATEVPEDLKLSACAWNLDILNGPVEGMKRLQIANRKRLVEQFLCDKGYSANEAKKIVSGPRDEDREKDEITAALKRTIDILKQ